MIACEGCGSRPPCCVLRCGDPNTGNRRVARGSFAARTGNLPGNCSMGTDKHSNSQATAPRGRGTLWALTAGQRVRYAAAIVAMGVGTVFLLLVPYVLQNALDALGRRENGRANRRGRWCSSALAIVGFNALHGLFTYVRGKWAAEASEGIVRRLRHELYSHLERLPSCVSRPGRHGRSGATVFERRGNGAGVSGGAGRGNCPRRVLSGDRHADHACAGCADDRGVAGGDSGAVGVRGVVLSAGAASCSSRSTRRKGGSRRCCRRT